jgi:hypothetical protein
MRQTSSKRSIGHSIRYSDWFRKSSDWTSEHFLTIRESCAVTGSVLDSTTPPAIFNGDFPSLSNLSLPSLCTYNSLHAIKLTTRLACMWIWHLPESPRWLVGQGRHAEAIAVLAALDDKPVDDPEVLETWKGIVDSASQSTGDFAFGELLQHGRMQHFRRTCLGVLVQCVSRHRLRLPRPMLNMHSSSRSLVVI